ncbi:achaete-scute homolog 5-like [Octopus sinensis]|uniref:Achaete-scute homolog 5-like n=1 Tax=Octopus sinensis TaxID=2607531 RepID=A0A7E6EKN3_9MOLL|nr:achaete-scute homolog 5-like [Octopus sinensis]
MVICCWHVISRPNPVISVLFSKRREEGEARDFRWSQIPHQWQFLLKNDPFSPHCLIPLPSHLMDFNGGFEPAFIRKRNERERERVRCVNEGYAQLKKHLPLAQKDKRLSKVETLRTAIHYIRYLEDMLQMSSDTTKGKI